MTTFLFTTLPTNDLGLLTRSLPIARELREQGHTIVFCSPAKACIGYLVHPFPKLTTWSITSLLFFFVMWYSTKEEVGEFLSSTRERSS